MSEAHTEYENVQFEIENIRLKVDDLNDDNPKIQKVYFTPTSEKIEQITYKPRKEVEKEITVNSATTFTDKKVPKTRGELADVIEELIQANASNDTIMVNGSFHKWDQSADPEEENDGVYYYIQEYHLDDWSLVVPDQSPEIDMTPDEREDENEQESANKVADDENPF